MDERGAFETTWFAMGTEWQIKLYADRSPQFLRSVAEAVVEEVESAEQMLSFYRDASDLRELNATAGLAPVPVDPRLLRLLQRAEKINAATGGAFDPTIGPLLRCWGFVGGSGIMPDAAAIAEAVASVGMHHVLLDAAACTVAFDRHGVELEFGAIGKGYAIERAVELLRDEYEIESALLHGGGSTFYGLGAPPGEEAWNVAIQRPNAGPGDTVCTIALRDRAVSVSAPHGKWFEQGGRRYGHVLDPRTAYPAAGSLIAVVATASATDSDALSTALLVLGAEGIPLVRATRPDAYVLVGAYEQDGQMTLTEDGPNAPDNRG